MSKPYYHAIAFISDIHSNIEALDAVINDIEKQEIEYIYCLGDVVGYGPNPIECIQKLQELQKKGKLVNIIAGNHDYGVCHKNFENYNKSAKLSDEWNSEILKDEPEFKFIKKLVEAPFIKKIGRFQLVHSTINPEPEKWEYLKTKNASDNFIEKNIIYVGHSHIPALYSKFSSGKTWNPIALFENKGFYIMPPCKNHSILPLGKSLTQYRLQLDGTFPTMIVNVGSVGQPRDGNPNARYLINITVDYHNYLEYREVGYDIEKTVDKLKTRNLSCDKELAISLCTGGKREFDNITPKPAWFNFD